MSKISIFDQKMKISENRKFSYIRVFEGAESNGEVYFALKCSLGGAKEDHLKVKSENGPKHTGFKRETRKGARNKAKRD